MASVFLSPSTQHYNLYVTGNSEPSPHHTTPHRIQSPTIPRTNTLSPPITLTYFTPQTGQNKQSQANLTNQPSTNPTQNQHNPKPATHPKHPKGQPRQSKPKPGRTQKQEGNVKLLLSSARLMQYSSRPISARTATLSRYR